MGTVHNIFAHQRIKEAGKCSSFKLNFTLNVALKVFYSPKIIYKLTKILKKGGSTLAYSALYLPYIKNVDI